MAVQGEPRARGADHVHRRRRDVHPARQGRERLRRRLRGEDGRCDAAEIDRVVHARGVPGIADDRRAGDRGRSAERGVHVLLRALGAAARLRARQDRRNDRPHVADHARGTADARTRAARALGEHRPARRDAASDPRGDRGRSPRHHRARGGATRVLVAVRQRALRDGALGRVLPRVRPDREPPRTLGWLDRRARYLDRARGGGDAAVRSAPVPRARRERAVRCRARITLPPRRRGHRDHQLADPARYGSGVGGAG